MAYHFGVIMWNSAGMKFKKILMIVVFAAGSLCWCMVARGGGDDYSTSTESDLTRQQKVNRSSLFTASDEQIRIEAAIVLLLSEDKQSRQILLEAITQQANPLAQATVCKALAQSRSLNIRGRGEFLEPLFAIVLNGTDPQAKAAAEALLIFDYKTAGERLERVINDESIAIGARLRAIYALKLRSDEKEPYRELRRLLDSKDLRISGTAELALQDLLGVPVGTPKPVWDQVIKDRESKDRFELVRDRLLKRESQVREFESQILLWQQMYLDAATNWYELLQDDTQRADFLMKRLSSDAPPLIQRWAIWKITAWRMGEKPLPQSFGPMLVALIKSSDPAVRLETARLLAITSYLVPADKLLAQLLVEKEEQIKLELFSALGEACNYAKNTNPDSVINNDIYVTTLDWAGQFLNDPNEIKSQKGAEVMCKLLINDGLNKVLMQKYLEMLSARYSLAKQNSAIKLQAALLEEMGTLCGAKMYRADSAKIFEPLFMDALGDKEPSIRENAVAGIIIIDEPKAREVLTGKSLYTDASRKIRLNVIALAGRVGSEQDLNWLVQRISQQDTEEAWSAMLEIFKRSKADTLADWVSKLDADPNVVISPERKIALLEMALQRSQGENISVTANMALCKRLADSYIQTGQTDEAMKYYDKIVQQASTGKEREEALTALFDLQLKLSKYDAAAQVMANRLIEKDVDANDVFVLRVDSQMSSLPAADKTVLLAAIKAIKNTETRAGWQQQIKKWDGTAAVVVDPNAPAAKG